MSTLTIKNEKKIKRLYQAILDEIERQGGKPCVEKLTKSIKKPRGIAVFVFGEEFGCVTGIGEINLLALTNFVYSKMALIKRQVLEKAQPTYVDVWAS